MADTAKATSSKLNSIYLLSGFMPYISTIDSFENTLIAPDLFNPRVNQLLELLSTTQIVRYQSGQKMPVITNAALGNTTAWWIVCAFNAITNAMSVATGRLINIPNVQAAAQQLQYRSSISSSAGNVLI